MTQEQLNSEIAWYSYICREQFKGDWITIDSIEVYSDRQKDITAAEVAYYYEHGELPSWATMIEYVQPIDDWFRFVHTDIDARV